MASISGCISTCCQRNARCNHYRGCMRYVRLTKQGSAAVVAVSVLAVAGCSMSSSDLVTTTTIGTVVETTHAVAGTSAVPTTVNNEVPTVEELMSEVQGKFTQQTYSDTQSGKNITYNVFLPEGYRDSKQYPLVVYIPDASLVGKSSAEYLSQYGALIWASKMQQREQETIVVVPQYEERIIDDNNGAKVVSDYVDATGRMITWLQTKYAVDDSRVYGTGQSMGCMATMYLAAQVPDLFAAVLLVSGQWDTADLTGLADSRMMYITAAGDAKASAGQAAVKKMFEQDQVEFAESSKPWDATWPMARQNEYANELFAKGSSINLATFSEGSVIAANPVADQEHMASFEPAYRIPAVRDWLLSQHKVEVDNADNSAATNQ